MDAMNSMVTRCADVVQQRRQPPLDCPYGHAQVIRGGPVLRCDDCTEQAAGIAVRGYFRRSIAFVRRAGLTQWRTLMNETLVVEDFAHTDPRECLFVQRPCKSDYALALERPSICPGCFEFYHCLGADAEIVALAEMLKSLQNARPGSRLAPALR